MNLADRPLLGIEQLSLGGNDSVRGYRQNAFLRDNGALGSCELGIPLYTSNKHALQLRPFVDFGTGWNNERIDPLAGPIETSRTLLSVGLGLTYQLKDNLFAQINWGIPLLSGAEGGSPDNNPVTFSLQWQN
ncbi:MAG: BamA/TamA family outer membrane protein [Acaryochloridaceae cyanobacterium CSU_3_4]|nr:BamA/TamA family outer membrane protein [Acaryochloridaceae cyanobacterium CSU_3_4]